MKWLKMMFYPEEIQFIQDSAIIEFLFSVLGHKGTHKMKYLDNLIKVINPIIGDTRLGIVILTLILSCYEAPYAHKVQYLDEAWDRWQDYSIMRSIRILEQIFGCEYGECAYGNEEGTRNNN